jgi:WD40 repeat protein
MQILSIGRKKRIHAVAFSPSGRRLATPCGDGQLRVWDLTTGKVVQSVAIAETSCGYDIAYPDEDRLVFAGIDLLWWDMPANAWNLICPGMRWNRQLSLSPDGRYLAEVDQITSTDWGGSGLSVRETISWQALPPLAYHTDTTGGVAFSPDSRLLATGHIVRVGDRQRSFGHIPAAFAVPAYDYVVHIQDLSTGQRVRSLDGWQQGVGHLAFTRRGNILVGTAGPRLRVWDLESDAEIALHKRGPKHFQGIG